MRPFRYCDDNWVYVGLTAVVGGRCIAGQVSDGEWMVVSFWLADRISGRVRLANDNLNRT